MGTLRSNSVMSLMAITKNDSQAKSGLVLMVGEPQRLKFLKKHFPDQSNVFLVSFSDLSREIFIGINPEVVVCPAMSDSFDCIDLAQVLVDAKFAGAFRILGQSLPRPDLIAREIRQNFPNLDSGFVEETPEYTEQYH